MIGSQSMTASEIHPTIVGPGREPAPIDLIHLARQTFGSAELEREVLRLFVLQGATIARQIGAAPSVEERAAFAHRVKGSARAIGAMRVGRIAEALETAAPGDVAGIAAELGQAIGEVERFVAGLLAPAA